MFWNAAGQDTLEIVELRDQNTGLLGNSERRILAYDPSGNNTNILYSIWNATTGIWVDDLRWHYSYDANGNRTSVLEEVWYPNTNSWMNRQRSGFSYHTSGKLLTDTSQYYNASNHTWSTSVIVYGYNSANHLTNRIQLGGTASSLDKGDSISYAVLNAAGMPLVALRYSWDRLANPQVWKPSARVFATYTSTNKLDSSRTENWNGTQFQDANKQYCYYDIQDRLVKQRIMVASNLGWKLGREERLYYDLVPASIIKAKRNRIFATIFPNPVSEHVTLSLSTKEQQQLTCTIYNASGQQVHQTKEWVSNSYNKVISVSHLPTGNYFVTVQGKEGAWSSSFHIAH